MNRTAITYKKALDYEIHRSKNLNMEDVQWYQGIRHAIRHIYGVSFAQFEKDLEKHKKLKKKFNS